MPSVIGITARRPTPLHAPLSPDARRGWDLLAAKSHVSIAALCEALGLRFFEADGDEAKFTDEGRTMVEHARQIADERKSRARK